jgi:predicted short-subunit dehydrogenase-like oxidoreductase (DUF2520 family)
VSASSIAVIGGGRAGGSLARTPGITVRVLVHRDLRVNTAPRAPWRECALVVLAVPDDALGGVARALASLAFLPPLVVHMSGALGPSVLLPLLAERGVSIGTFHPLASLDGKGRIPVKTLVAVDARARIPKLTRAVLAQLSAMAKRMKLAPAHVPEDKRALYHAGAVVAGNLPVALLAYGVRLLVDAGVPEHVARASLARLLASQADNAIAAPLARALTGPVARGDTGTIARHLAALDAAHPEIAAVYRELTAVLERLLSRS